MGIIYFEHYCFSYIELNSIIFYVTNLSIEISDLSYISPGYLNLSNTSFSRLTAPTTFSKHFWYKFFNGFMLRYEQEINRKNAKLIDFSMTVLQFYPMQKSK